MSDFLGSLGSFIINLHLPYLFTVFLAFLVVERLFPAQRNQSFRGIGFNVRYTVLYFVIAALVQPIIGFTTSFVIARSGGGWIPVPSLAGLGNLFVFDIFYYWFHRIQHTVPALWSQHKLHHSDTEVNVTTTHRHHWLEEPLRMVFVLIPMSIVFATPPAAGGLIGLVLGLWGFFIHSNLRLNLAFLTPVIAGPQAHRIHHSVLPNHANRNYAAFFPVLDVVFGTFTWPKRAEFPPTGLHSNENVYKLSAASLWPFREWRTGKFLESAEPARSRVWNYMVLGFIAVVFFGSGSLYFSRTAVRSVEQTMEFKSGSSAVQYLVSGWSEPEATHTWTNSTRADLHVRLSEPSSKIRASFVVRAFVDRERKPAQRYRILLDGEQVAASEIRSSETVTIDFDADIQPETKELHFTLETPDAKSPKDLGISPDPRDLGLSLLTLKLQTIE